MSENPLDSVRKERQITVTAAAIAAILVAVLTVFFQYTKTGRALRAVADDHQAALSIGVPLERITTHS